MKLHSFHLRNFHKDLNITCSLDHLTFNSQREYILHVNVKHPNFNEKNEHLCSECDRPFKDNQSNYALLTHIRVDHFNYQPYQCDQCPKKFDTVGRLSHHTKQSHNTKENFQCDICSENFSTKGRKS